MDDNKIIEVIDDIISRVNSSRRLEPSLLESKQFIGQILGKDSCYYTDLDDRINIIYGEATQIKVLAEILESLKNYIKNGLLNQPSLIREIQIDTVSDYLELARNLLNDSSVHPAAPAMIIGASLEEFLRNWVEEIGKLDEISKPSIDSYKSCLRHNNLISKQDDKDIVSWAGIRNDASHGNWEKVENKEKIELMLQGVNLFIRKYSKS